MAGLSHEAQNDRRLLDAAAEVLRAEARAVTNAADQLDASFAAAVRAVLACRGTVITSGMGKSGLVAQKLSATLASTGTPSHFLHPSEAMHGDIGRIRAGDLLIALSYGGNTEDLLALAALVRQDGVPIVSITGPRKTHLASLAGVSLCVGDVTEACPHNLAPTASTTAMLALGDALALAVSGARAFSADDFHKRHPGGHLGRQLMPIVDVLRFRADENLPLLAASLTVAQVLDAASKASGAPRRAGAVLLVDPAGALAGIFTDGDLRRLLVHQGAAGLDRPIAEVMTVRPRCLTDDALVRDAVQMMRELRVDEIPVVDATGAPVGLVDVQDLVALKVIEP